MTPFHAWSLIRCAKRSARPRARGVLARTHGLVVSGVWNLDPEVCAAWRVLRAPGAGGSLCRRRRDWGAVPGEAMANKLSLGLLQRPRPSGLPPRRLGVLARLRIRARCWRCPYKSVQSFQAPCLIPSLPMCGPPRVARAPVRLSRSLAAPCCQVSAHGCCSPEAFPGLQA